MLPKNPPDFALNGKCDKRKRVFLEHVNRSWSRKYPRKHLGGTKENSVKQKVFLLSLINKYLGGKDFENM